MKHKIILAYSGGLDTSFCIPYLKETYDSDIIAVYVDCLGTDPSYTTRLKEKARSLGAKEFISIDAFDDLYNKVIKWLIFGNVLRDRTYPLSVGAERFIQAFHVAAVSKAYDTKYVAHGSTGAGNDQIRFDIALRSILTNVEIITPIRDLGLTRSFTTNYLTERGHHVDIKNTLYSINEGIWGTTIGGVETSTSDKALPYEAFPNIKNPNEITDQPEEFIIEFQKGMPVLAGGISGSPKVILNRIKDFGIQHGIGRGMHLGDTILGIKGRIGFEAPVATILYFAHRELEKLVLTKWQRHLKDQLADTYGMLLHEGQFFDPVLRDIESYFESSQDRVTGSVRIHAYRGSLFAMGVKSPNSLMDNDIARYGEENSGWTGDEARAFAKIYGLSSQLAHKSKKK